MPLFCSLYMKRVKRIYITVLMLMSLALTGCGSDISISAKADGSTDIAIDVDIGQTVGGLIKALYGMSGASNATSLISAEELNASLTQSGYTNVQTKSSDTAITAKATMPARTKSLLVEQKNNSITVTFSPQVIQSEYQALDETAKAYIDLLMAPLFTGEILSTKEYLELIASAYGNDLVSELKNSYITLSLSQPQGTKRKSHSIFYCYSQSAQEQVYRIPLVEFLTFGCNKEDEESFSFSVSWE